MNTPAKVGAHAVGLAAVFAAALGVGTAVGPVGAADTQPRHGSSHDATAGRGDAAGHAAGGRRPPTGTTTADAFGHPRVEHPPEEQR